jgi:hypothetical protein
MNDESMQKRFERFAEYKGGKVRSKDMAEPVRKTRKQPKVSGEWLDTRLAPNLEFFGAILLLIISYVGMVMAINGKWTLKPDISACIFAFIGQGVLTIWEWLTRKKKLSIMYLIPLSLDVVSTVWGYEKVIYRPINRQITAVMKMQFTDLEVIYYVGATLTWAIIILAACLLAYLPEAVLIEE